MILKNLKKIIKAKAEYELSPESIFNICAGEEYSFDTFKYINKDMASEMKAFLELGKAKKCLLDIGSLYGIFSLAFTSVNPVVKSAYAIEPSSVPFDKLKRHIRMNPALRIEPFQIALSNREGTLPMRHEWQHLVALTEEEPDDTAVKMAATTLDKFLHEKKISPDIIKIDTEGHEFHILEGGRSFLREKDVLIFLEIHPPRLKAQGIPIGRLVAFVRLLGYHIYGLDYKPLSVDFLEHCPAFSCVDSYRIICRKDENRK